jgi:hypothetical protein
MFGLLYMQEKESTQNFSEDWLLLSQVRLASENILVTLNLKKISEQKRSQWQEFVSKNCVEFINGGPNVPIFISEDEEAKLEECRDNVYQDKIIELKCDVFNVSRKAPFTVDEMTKRIESVVKSFQDKTEKKVFIGEIHDWDQERKKDLRREYPVAINFSKVLTALSLGVSSRYLITNKDKELRSWLEAQELTSVGVEDIFSKSLELQEGDIYRALLSIENVLSEFWKSPNRNNIVQTTKLKSITNHCPGAKPEDVFGSWYHMFGMMLYGCVSGPIRADVVGLTEAAGGRVLDLKGVKKEGESVFLHLLIGSDPQEEKINRNSGNVGHRLCRSVRRGEL